MKNLRLVALAIALLVGHAESFAATRIVGNWKASAVIAYHSEQVPLVDENKQVIAVISRDKIARLLTVFNRLEKVSGISADLYILQSSDATPNAFATTTNGRNVVGITPAMLNLLGDDFDAYAAILGHELAHLVKQHGSERVAREGFVQAIGVIASIVIGARTGINLGGVADLGVNLINKTYSREDEREADRLGISYMKAAGFDPQGGIRLHQRLITAGTVSRVPFLDTHPSGDERINNMREWIAKNSLDEKEIDSTKPEQLARTTYPVDSKKSDSTENHEFAVASKIFIDDQNIYTSGLTKPELERGKIEPSLVFLADSGWDIEQAYSGMRRALSILSQCGLSASGFNVYVIRTPSQYVDFSTPIAKEWVPKVPTSRPAIYFVRKNAEPKSFQFEVIAAGNSQNRPTLRDSIWVEKSARDLGEGISRMLMLMLMNRNEVSTAQGSLFYANQTSIDNSFIDRSQCDRAIETGRSNGLLK